jgi:hypothetical protein
MTGLLLLPALFALAVPSSEPVQRPETSKDNQVIEFNQYPIALPQTDSGPSVCLKLRMYIFERNDGDAPKFVRETTCGPVRPRLRQSKFPKARLIPAN